MSTRSSPRRPVARLNLSAAAWRRLRQVYGDQPIPFYLNVQNRFAGAWLSALERISARGSELPVEPARLTFVIGHWRSGTTFLHEMICENPAFNYPTTYACMNPQVFAATQATVLRGASGRVVRPMDNVTVSLASPQEDEFALLALGAPSPYEAVLFPRALDRAFAVADPDDLAPHEREAWVEVFLRFVGQVAALKPGSPLVLKSPTHSYRVRLLSRLFPDARFIHVVRNPGDVFSSTLNMWRKLWSRYGLTDTADESALVRQVIANWIRLEEKLDAVLPALPADRYVRVHYEAITARPLEEMERIYGALKLQDFTAALPYLEGYLASRALFEKNRFDLPPEEARHVFRSWRHIFEKYQYAPPTF